MTCTSSGLPRRDLVSALATVGAAAFLPKAAIAAPSGLDIFSGVDPQLVAPLRGIPADLLTRSASLANLSGLRQRNGQLLPLPAIQPREHVIQRPSAPPLRVLLFDGAPERASKPAFLYIHGGGFVSGFPDAAPLYTQLLAAKHRCLVVSVDYRLAPETPFPGALNDNLAALRWLHGNSENLKVDRNRIAVGGESAGGGHAAMLALAARADRDLPIVFQLLIYPMLDDRTGSRLPVPDQEGRLIWNAASNRFGWTSLLGVPAGSEGVPIGSVPAREADLAGLPPAFIGVGALDLFVDEDVNFARRLIAAGVPTELLVVPGAFHGFDMMPGASVATQFVETWTRTLDNALNG